MRGSDRVSVPSQPDSGTRVLAPFKEHTMLTNLMPQGPEKATSPEGNPYGSAAAQAVATRQQPKRPFERHGQLTDKTHDEVFEGCEKHGHEELNR